MAGLLRLYDKLITALAVVASAVVATMCAMVLFDVTMRSFGVALPAFAVTIVEYSLLYLTMSAAPWLVRERGHVYIDLVIQAVPGPVRRIGEKVIYIITIIACLIIAGTAAQLAWDAINSDRMDVRGIDVPLWVSIVPLPVGFGLVAVEFFLLMVRGESYYDRGSEGRGVA